MSTPPNGNVWHKAFFSGSRAGPEPTGSRHFQKMPTDTLVFALLLATLVPANSHPHKWGKSLGESPPPWGRRKSPGTETHSARTVPQITRPAEVLPGKWRGADRTDLPLLQRNLSLLITVRRVHFGVMGKTQGRMKGQHKDNQTHTWKFPSLAC